MEIAPDTQLGRYRVLGPLGRGGMGEVYLAVDGELKRTVAIKILPLAVADDAQRLNRFLREARAASALNHPNILTIYEVGRAGASHFIASEFVEGATLRQRLLSGPISVDEAVKIATQAAAALAAAHVSGIIHRDIKPENVMVRRDGYVKVLDFGLAKFLEGDASADHDTGTTGKFITATGVVMGTVAYMSPEQARGDTVDARTDVWSLGIVLYELLSGRLPFEGRTRLDQLFALVNGEATPLSVLVPTLPPALAAIVDRAMQRSAADRYSSAVELAEDLRRLRGESSPAGSGSQDSTVISGAASRASAPRAVLAPTRSDTAPPPPSNLSEELAPLVGRGREVDALCAELRRPEVRLVTLTGVGGTGKTRLAVQLARNLLGDFADGVFLVELASVRRQEDVAVEIARTLGLGAEGDGPAPERLRSALVVRQTLLVLDNFEQVVGAAPLLASLLAAAPGLKLVVTSRSRLNLRAEREHAVAPLGLPPLDPLPPIEDLASYAAVALFVARAREVRPDFELTRENARVVATVCDQLDGLPLALELAAARLRLLTVDELRARLRNRLKVLTGGARDLPERQRTMRAAIAWSYELLDEDERRLLRRLSVFAGGCTLEAAEAVCDTGEETASRRLSIDVLDGLTSLEEKNLVRHKHGDSAEGRFSILETIREFGLECLEASGEHDAVRALHAQYFLGFAEIARAHLNASTQLEWYARLVREQENLRAALDRLTAPGGDAGVAVRLGVALGHFWMVSGSWREGGDWLRSALNAAGDLPAALRAEALHWMGALAAEQGEYRRARTLLEQSLAISRATPGQAVLMNTLSVLSNVASHTGDHARATELRTEFLAVARANGDRAKIAAATNGLGLGALARGDYEPAAAWFAEALEMFRAEGNLANVSVSLHNLGDIAMRRGEHARASEFLEESLLVARAVGANRVVAHSAHVLGSVALGMGQADRAEALFREALAIDRENDDKAGIAFVLEGFAGAAASRGLADRALRIAAAAAALREEIDSALAPARKAVDGLRAAKLEAEGRALGLERAIDLVVGETRD